jgi:hypothetical protein
VNTLNKQLWTAEKGWSFSLGVGREANNTAVTKQPRQQKMDMRFGTWNVRSLYRTGSLKTVANEMAKCNLDLVAVQEVRWDKCQQVIRMHIFLWNCEC